MYDRGSTDYSSLGGGGGEVTSYTEQFRDVPLE